MQSRARLHRVAVGALVAAVGLAMTTAVVHAQPNGLDGKPSVKARHTNNVYIVQLAELPVTAYAGGIAGYAATKPAKGQKIDPLDSGVRRYKAYLTSRHDTVLSRAGGANKLYSYGYVFNGFAAELSKSQAEQLAATPGVLAVTKDELQQLDTATTPKFLGLTNAAGQWTFPSKGEGVVIGIVDTGVWPEHPSFSDRTDVNGNGTKGGKLGYQQIPGWNAKCTPGEAFNASHCNQKLIGAQYFNAGFGGNAGIDAQFPFEFNSPRDWNGHGTHTATTAGGNANVPATGAAAVFGTISGIAPRARISSYKVCWADSNTGGGCFPSDSVAAIDQAVADGVDVINFSISGTRTNFLDPVELAFLRAADAGVFVAASAGNSGPASSTVAHPSPWITTVAAATHDRDGAGSVSFGNGTTYNGASMATLGGAGPAPFIDSQLAGLTGADPTAVRLCYSAADNGGAPVLDPTKVAGKIVLCDRGITARVNKSQAVKDAGGIGMVLVNTSTSSINADLHAVPSVHLQYTADDYAALHTYAQSAGATATINQAALVSVPAPFTASFSSRGPLLAAGGDLLKPDLIAPGQDILAGVAPPGNGGKLFDLYSGTSMSSPHVAGLAALFKALYPSWSPMAIKSALMTTATDVLDGGTPAPNTNPVLIFRQGAGHVRPTAAVNPGLVFDSNFVDWVGFLCGTAQLAPSVCAGAGIPVLDPSDLNGASIAVGDLPGSQTITRRVTNVGSTATFTASATGMTGFNVTVTPASFSIGAGETKSITVQITNTGAPVNTYRGGQLRLSDGTRTVRVPMVVRPVALGVPSEVSGSYQVRFGYTGAFSATGRGLVAADTTAGTVADDPTNGSCSLASPNAQQIPVNIPPGTTYARFSLFDADVTPGADIDLCVANAGGAIVGSSGSGTSAEEVNLSNPAAGNYTVVVQGWGVVGSSPFKLHTWLVGGPAVPSNLTVTAPAAAAIGTTGTINITTNGLAPATKYLGTVSYGGVPSPVAPTVIRIDTP